MNYLEVYTKTKVCCPKVHLAAALLYLLEKIMSARRPSHSAYLPLSPNVEQDPKPVPPPT